jgi:hypothetical protein
MRLREVPECERAELEGNWPDVGRKTRELGKVGAG